jgi:hypothetical protein
MFLASTKVSSHWLHRIFASRIAAKYAIASPSQATKSARASTRWVFPTSSYFVFKVYLNHDTLSDFSHIAESTTDTASVWPVQAASPSLASTPIGPSRQKSFLLPHFNSDTHLIPVPASSRSVLPRCTTDPQPYLILTSRGLHLLL